MISKELLSEVLGENIISIKPERNVVTYEYPVNACFVKKINIYELAFKVKEWVSIKGFIMVSNNLGFLMARKRSNDNIKRIYEYEYDSLEELKTIFKAGEWVLETDNGFVEEVLR